MRVLLTDSAIEQLAHIHRYIVENHGDTKTADKLVQDIINGASDLLTLSPKAGRQLNNENERFIVIRNHSIYYEIREEGVAIVGVYGKGQNWR